MPAGRKRKSSHLHVLQGTRDRSKSRAKPAVTASSTRPTAPNWLSEKETVHFEQLVDRLVEIGAASGTYTEAIATAAVRMVEIEILSEAIEDAGHTYETISTTGSRMIKARPEVAQRSEALRHLQSLLAEMGLTPSAISRVQSNAGTSKPASRWAAIK